MKRSSAYLAALSLVVASATGAPAQDDDGGFLENLIESSLSGEDRDVVIQGFEGLLSGRARFARMTISDRDGVWLTVTDAELDWRRLALLRGRLEVSSLTAENIDFPRAPRPAETAPPAPEASGGFALPELPVAVNIGEFSVGRVSLGASLFGEAAELSATGSASLADGEGAAELVVDRLDGDGRFEMSGAYENASTNLALTLAVDEAPDGIVVNLVNIPGTPSLDLEVAGEGPLNDYTADIRLATDGTDRLTGRVTTRTGNDVQGASRAFTATLSGDVTPLFLPDYRDFFGDDLSLDIAATRSGDGTFDISRLALDARALRLDGRITIGPDGLPVLVDLDGRIAAADGSPVLLPVAGDPIRVDGADLAVTFDVAAGDAWTADVTVAGLEGVGYTAETFALVGRGSLSPLAPGRAVSGSLVLDARQLDLGGEEIDAALGSDLQGEIDFDWREGAPFEIPQFEITGRDYGLTGAASVAAGQAGVDVTADVAARADDIAAFSGLARRPLAGAIDANATLALSPLTGAFDITARAGTSDLSVGQAEADRVLAGEATLELVARRDTGGLEIERFALASPNATAEGRALLNSGASTVGVDADLADVALIVPELQGAITFSAEAEQNGEVWTYRARSDGPLAELDIDGLANLAGETPEVSASLDGRLPDLSAFSEIADRPLTGTARLSGTVSGRADLSSAAADLTGQIENVSFGLDQVDPLLEGVVDAAIQASLSDGVYRADLFELSGDHLELAARAGLGDGDGVADIVLTIREAARIAPGAEGPVRLALLADEGEGGEWRFDIDGTGAGIAVDASGTTEPFATPIALDSALSLRAADLSPLEGLVGLPLRGAVSLDGRIAGLSDLSAADVDLIGSTRNLAMGIPTADRLLAGTVDLQVKAIADGDRIDIDTMAISGRAFSVAAQGTTRGGRGTIETEARLNDLGLFLPSFPGAVELGGDITLSGGPVAVDLGATGPGGLRADISGDIAQDGSDARLSVVGSGPLELANPFIAPITISGPLRFDLAVNGPPSINAVSGDISSAGGRLVLPGANIILEDIDIATRLSGGRALIDLSAGLNAGGRVAVRGPLDLGAPFAADLRATLASAVFTDGALYRARLSGDLGVNGPLAGGALISGDIAVEEAEINIANTGAGAAGAIPDIIHVNEPDEVRQTRAYAGLVRDDAAGNDGGGPAYPLDVRFTAERIFVRGRGLDAELGGELAVRGTSANVIPVGRFDLVRGRLNLLGSRLDVEEGAILMQGALEPVLQFRAVRARRSRDDIAAFVTIDGPVSDPEIGFESSPPLPEEEVLALILFGTEVANISALQAAQLASAAATLAGGGGGVIDNVRSRIGVDDLDVSTDEEGNTSVTAGAYLNENVYADVTTRSDGQSEVRLNFDVTDSISLSGSTSSTGESSVGVFFQRDY